MAFPHCADHSRLIPCCPSCQSQYDVHYSPHVLPCGHSFCGVCLRRQKKKRCLRCGKKYRRFNCNVALKGVVESLRYLNEMEAEKSERCDECDERYPLRWMRACHTCKEDIQKIVNHSLLQCHICLECCVSRHNGHYYSRIDISLPREIHSHRHPLPSAPYTRRHSSVALRSTSTPHTRHVTPSSSRFYSTIIDPVDESPRNQSVENHTYFSGSPNYINIGAEEVKKCRL
ncbi:hypothetical protein QR680_008026 [Steinernema hermaphroditum]|uniref:RING-type domain-containing protein n=1 Tax=Steinernema hermaphroditum TaxID=289476 RepID=A0AA39IGM7_9BILA|nr:hypothetical protein QR680_008026 [Steinernema hermaphroditum]